MKRSELLIMKRVSLFLIGTVLLLGCTREEIPDSRIPDDANRYCNKFMHELKKGNIDSCFNAFAAKYQNEKTRQSLYKTYLKIKDKEPVNKKVTNARSTYSTLEKAEREYLQYEYEYNEFWLYLDFNLIPKDNSFSVHTFIARPHQQSLRKLHGINFLEKGFIHYLFTGLSIAIVFFMLISLIFAIKTPLTKKWLWIIYILFAFGSIQLNWTTGELGFSLVSIKLLGAGFSQGGIVSPWIMSFGIPVGAIHFWVKRIKLNKQDNETGEKIEAMTQ